VGGNGPAVMEKLLANQGKKWFSLAFRQRV